MGRAADVLVKAVQRPHGLLSALSIDVAASEAASSTSTAQSSGGMCTVMCLEHCISSDLATIFLEVVCSDFTASNPRR